MTKQYNFNKDNFEFYMSDDSVAQAYQIEGSEVWSLEIFTPNQTKESFESAEFSGFVNFVREYNKWDINFPSTWTEDLKQEFVHSLQAEINEVKLLSVEEDMLNQKGCYYARPNGEDCSQYNEAEVNKYYDFCENCSRYHTCNSVALLDNRLKEIHEVE